MGQSGIGQKEGCSEKKSQKGSGKTLPSDLFGRHVAACAAAAAACPCEYSISQNAKLLILLDRVACFREEFVFVCWAQCHAELAWRWIKMVATKRILLSSLSSSEVTGNHLRGPTAMRTCGSSLGCVLLLCASEHGLARVWA